MSTVPLTPGRFHLSAPAGAAAGVGLAVVMLAPLLLLSKEAGMQFLAVMLGFVGAVYFGFGIADGRLGPLLAEFTVAGTFLLAGSAVLWADSPALLAAGYGTHALWDLVHHPRAVATGVERWYPPFCVAYDVVVAVFVLAWLPSGGVA